MSTKVLVWGLGQGYIEIKDYLEFWREKGSIDIVEYVDKTRVGLISEIKYEYIIVTTELYYDEIVEYCKNYLNVDRNKILRGKIFKIPNFNWDSYIRIYEKSVSVIAEACYGGIMSNFLGLEFNSPFVNDDIKVYEVSYVTSSLLINVSPS